MPTANTDTRPVTAPPGTGRGEGLALRTALGQVRQRTPRRLGQWAASVLFVLVVVIGLVALFNAQSDRVEVLATTRPVAAGHLVEASDVHPVDVAGVDGAIPAVDVDLVVGKRAATGLVEGQVLTSSALTDEAVPGPRQRLVALQLSQGRVPGGLAAGDVVDVLAAPVDGDTGTRAQLQQPRVLAPRAVVESVRRTPDAALVVTVLTGEGTADRVAAHNAAGRVTVVQAPITATGE